MRRRQPTARTVADNIQWLKASTGDTYRDIEQRSGVGRSIIQRIAAGQQSPTIEQADAIASAFGLDGWHLLLPNLPHDVAETKTISHLIESYFASSAIGRINITRVADLEAKDNTTDP